MTEEEKLKKIGEYLDIFQPEARDTLTDFAGFLGLEASTVKWSVAISTLGIGSVLYEGVIDSLRNADPTYSNYTNGGKIVELNHSIYRSLINILGGDESVTDYAVFFTQIQNYIDDVFVPIDDGPVGGLLESLAATQLVSYVDLDAIITAENIKNSYYVSSYAIDTRIFNRQILTSASDEALRETIIESIGSDEFARIFGANRRIRYIIENGFSISDIGKFIAKGDGDTPGIEDFIKNLEDVQITINSEDGTKLFSTYQQVEDGIKLAKISQDYYPGQTGIDVGAVPAGTINKLNLDVVNFPSDVYGLDQVPSSTEYNQAALDTLKSSDEFGENGDITTYKFQFYKSITTSSISPNLIVNLWKSIFSSDKVTPEEMFLNQIKNRYMDFILKVLEDYQDDERLDETLTNKRNEVFDEEFKKLIYSTIAIDKEIARRVKIFQELEKIIDIEGRDSGNPLNRAEVKQIETQGAQAFVDTEVDQARKPLTDEQIESRQRFYKQCALMLNIH